MFVVRRHLIGMVALDPIAVGARPPDVLLHFFSNIDQ
jgi:hypothetical protein